MPPGRTETVCHQVVSNGGDPRPPSGSTTRTSRRVLLPAGTRGLRSEAKLFQGMTYLLREGGGRPSASAAELLPASRMRHAGETPSLFPTARRAAPNFKDGRAAITSSGTSDTSVGVLSPRGYLRCLSDVSTVPRLRPVYPSTEPTRSTSFCDARGLRAILGSWGTSVPSRGTQGDRT